MNWRLQFPNEAGVLAYTAHYFDHRLTVYYDPCGHKHRFLHQEVKHVGTNSRRTIDRRNTIKPVNGYPAEGWATSIEARKAAEDYLYEWIRGHYEHV